MTVPVSLPFLHGQAGFLRERGIEMQVITAPGEELERFGADEQVETAAVPMTRRITPLADLIAVFRLVREIHRRQPIIVHTHTPKAGLLGMIAASLVRVPLRIYHISGLPFVTESGIRRFILRATERVSCALAHRVLCVSRSVREIAVTENLCEPGKISVLLSGSINGLDAQERFNPARHGGAGQATRTRLGIPDDALVVGYVGRLVRDKGIAELARMFQLLRDELSALHLLLVGPFEPEGPVDLETRRQLTEDPRIHHVGLDWNTPPYYAAFNLLVLPSWREGFGLVLIEAAAMALPVVATRIPGCVDAVEDGVTGLLVPPRDPDALAVAVRRYLTDPDLARTHGQAGRARVLRNFQQEKMWAALEAFYRDALVQRGVAENVERARHREP